MTYIMPRAARKTVRRRKPMGMGDFLTDYMCSTFNVGCTGASDAPVINVAPTPDSTDTSSTTTVTDTSGGTFVTVNGVCKATTTAYLDQFKAMQRQANRIADLIGVAKIAVDGEIGPGTVGLLSAIKGNAKTTASFAGYDLSSCSAVATNAYALTGALSVTADALGASSSVSSPSASNTPSFVNPVTGQAQGQGLLSSIGDLFNNMSTTQQMMLGGGALFVGYMAFGKKKTKSATARRSTRR